jgi:outer membrane lipoprotein-sorting protein
VVDYPSEEFKDAAVQVMKGELSSKKGAQQSFVGLLTRGGILKQFSVSGVQASPADGQATYFLQPVQQSADFKRAQLTLSSEKKQIVELRYWDERDNETRFLFSNTKFDQAVDSKLFKFTPPKNAAVTAI